MRRRTLPLASGPGKGPCLSTRANLTGTSADGAHHPPLTFRQT